MTLISETELYIFSATWMLWARSSPLHMWLVAAAPPPFRPGKPALCGSRPL